MGTLKATIEGTRLIVQTQATEIEVEVARAIKVDHLIEHHRSNVKPREHLGLKGI